MTTKVSKYIFIAFIIVHAVLLNVNVAEWGDSYRILRASEFIQNFTYPADEKRPPLFSMLLAPQPAKVDQVMWGRVVMLIVSIISFALFAQLVDKFISNEKWKNFALIIFTFNPVFLYWSLRVYADVFFTLFVFLMFFNLYFSNAKLRYILLGILGGLAILTRFEGYILVFSVGLGILFRNGTDRVVLKKQVKDSIQYILGFLFLAVPYWIWRNPLNSSYFKEPSGRAYDLEMLVTFLLALIFMFGFTSAFYFIGRHASKMKSFVFKYLGIYAFIFVELVLVVLWPAAVPRLFVPIIPLGILVLTHAIEDYFENASPSWTDLAVQLFLLGIYAVGQYFFKLQFNVLIKPVFVLILLFQVFIIYFSYKKQYVPFLAMITLSCVMWSISTIWLHKDIYFAVEQSSDYAQERLTGNILYNDINSVTDWYLNYKEADEVQGIYYEITKPSDLNPEFLQNADIDYVLLTNEHDPNLNIEAEEDYLKLVESSDYMIGDVEFSARIYRFIHMEQE